MMAAVNDIEVILVELAVWRRHGVLVTEDCGTCEGTGIDRPEGCICTRFSDSDFRIADLMCSTHGVNGTSAQPDADWDPCPVCDGSGKVLKDGAETAMRRVLDHFGVYTPDLLTALSVAVASWLEGASDE